jgi:hypothetical protein
MKNINQLIKKLFTVSDKIVNGWPDMEKKMKEQDDLLDELEKESKGQKTLLGGIVRFPMADSYAIYVVTKVNKKTATLKWLDYCDGWVDSRCGKECSISLNYVENHINGKRKLDEIFGSLI